jgi:uncharacterized protein (TIGR00159 family)
LLDAFGDFGARDAFDLGVATLLLAVGLSWLRRSRAALVAVGIAVLACLYTVAVGLGLGLTTWLFHGFFAALALVLVVLFQDELRQAFEELAAWVLGRRDDYRPRLDAPEILVDALEALAGRRIGALVVLPGVQKLDRHMQGGEALDGRLSRALLESLFDPHSAGHDGAVVVENGRVARFGVQLPLTRNVNRLAGGGTRHSAALGLSERTDALCIVVSEERGTVSAARAGRLRELGSAPEMKAAIDRFHRKRRGLSRGGWLGWLRQRPAELVGAAALATLLWTVFVAGARPDEQVWSVPVRVLHAPEGTTLGALEPAEVDVTVSGTRRGLALTSRGQVLVTVDASLASASGASASGGLVRLPLTLEDVRHPERIKVERVHRDEVGVRLLPDVAAAATEAR